MKKVIYYEERGCFMKPERGDSDSNMQNFRTCFEINGKDGKKLFVELGGYDRKAYKDENGNKVPAFKNRLHTSLSYTDERGSWGIWAPYCGVSASNYSYTREDVLRYINAISVEQYDEMQPRLILDCKNHYSNCTGSGLIQQIVEDWRKFWNDRGGKFSDEYKVLSSYGQHFLMIRGEVYDFAGIANEKPIDEKHSDFQVIFDRITNKERAERIIENAVIC